MSLRPASEIPLLFSTSKRLRRAVTPARERASQASKQCFFLVKKHVIEWRKWIGAVPECDGGGVDGG